MALLVPVIHFNPRAPRGARLAAFVCDFPAFPYFNPRAPRGARRNRRINIMSKDIFQSTCPARGTTPPELGVIGTDAISIHVPREGHDVALNMPFRMTADFNPRAPRGARRNIFSAICKYVTISIHVPREGHDLERLPAGRPSKGNFNPRAPRGARPAHFLCAARAFQISIHVPREGHDLTSTIGAE